MKHQHYSDVAREGVEGYSGVTVRWLISKNDGAPTFAMRLFEVEPGGASPYHQHEWEHEVFMLEGRAEVVQDSGAAEVSAGDAVLVLPGEGHQFRNTGDGPARFLCMIPLPD